jgi:hypothetical protein
MTVIKELPFGITKIFLELNKWRIRNKAFQLLHLLLSMIADIIAVIFIVIILIIVICVIIVCFDAIILSRIFVILCVKII